MNLLIIYRLHRIYFPTFWFNNHWIKTLLIKTCALLVLIANNEALNTTHSITVTMLSTLIYSGYTEPYFVIKQIIWVWKIETSPLRGRVQKVIGTRQFILIYLVSKYALKHSQNKHQGRKWWIYILLKSEIQNGTKGFHPNHCLAVASRHSKHSRHLKWLDVNKVYFFYLLKKRLTVWLWIYKWLLLTKILLEKSLVLMNRNSFSTVYLSDHPVVT